MWIKYLISEFSSYIAYLIKCLIGVVICYALYYYIPQYPFYWAIVSFVLVLSPDKSNRLAYDRIKANTLGCAIGISLYPLKLPEILILCLGVALTIVVEIALGITTTLRTALASLVIIILQQEQTKHWYIALERVICVVAGCTVALLITILFNLINQEYSEKKT
jgi:uncharacterized membrane protein YgaE (UPF0421/DUF939 family)